MRTDNEAANDSFVDDSEREKIQAASAGDTDDGSSTNGIRELKRVGCADDTFRAGIVGVSYLERRQQNSPIH